MDEPAEALTEQRLRNAIDVVSEDAALVELWACALSGFAQPIPDYAQTTPSRLPRGPNILATPIWSGRGTGAPKRP
jgi:hypothetical protein